MSTPVLEVKNVTYEYPNFLALKNVSFSLYPSSVTALVGPNGAGKTTLLRCLAALDNPTSGEIIIEGISTITDPRSCHKYLGYLSDSFGLYDNLSVRQSLLHQGAISLLEKKIIDTRCEDLITKLDLNELLNQRTGNLSRGQRQRLGVALTLIPSPKILLLDEPASGLDPEARGELSKLFNSLKSSGISILVSSHILAELEDYSDRMLILKEGEIIGDEGINLEQKFKIRIDCDASSVKLKELLNNNTQVKSTLFDTEGVELVFAGTSDESSILLRELIIADIKIKNFYQLKDKLESVYLEQVRSK